MRIRRRNTVWLTILGVLVAIVVLSGAATPTVTAALIGLFGIALAASLIELRPRSLLETVPSSPLTMMKMSPQAREAAERARRRTAYTPSGLTLLDVGLISLQSSPEGMVMRRSRTISLDENGVRPYVTLNVSAGEADRNAVMRFEILDQNGQMQYVHEMKTYLRDGEMNILADHQLPLIGNDKLAGAGDWDLRVYADGALMGMLSFSTTPSLAERQRLFQRSVGDAALRLEDEAEDSPISLQDLLHADSKSRSQRQ